MFGAANVWYLRLPAFGSWSWKPGTREIGESRRQRGVGREGGTAGCNWEASGEREALRVCGMWLRGVAASAGQGGGARGSRGYGFGTARRRRSRGSAAWGWNRCARGGMGLGRQDGGAREARPLGAGTAALKGQRLGYKKILSLQWTKVKLTVSNRLGKKW